MLEEVVVVLEEEEVAGVEALVVQDPVVDQALIGKEYHKHIL
jgi:hypothetical protein